MIRADPCSPPSLGSLPSFIGLPLVIIGALLRARTAARHRDRLARADAESAGPRQARAVGEIVLEGDRLARDRSVPDVQRPVRGTGVDSRSQEERRADRRAELVGAGTAITRPGRKLDL